MSSLDFEFKYNQPFKQYVQSVVKPEDEYALNYSYNLNR